VWVYSNCESAELFLNGKSMGVRKKGGQWTPAKHRLMWENVKYKPGTLKAVAMDKKGKAVMTAVMKTAGAPARIELVPDRKAITADGEDLSFVTVKVVDKSGTVCPLAMDEVKFRVKGAGEIAGVDNGDQTSVESFAGKEHRVFHGLGMVIVRSKDGKPGSITVEATAKGLKKGTATLKSK